MPSWWLRPPRTHSRNPPPFAFDALQSSPAGAVSWTFCWPLLRRRPWPSPRRPSLPSRALPQSPQPRPTSLEPTSDLVSLASTYQLSRAARCLHRHRLPHHRTCVGRRRQPWWSRRGSWRHRKPLHHLPAENVVSPVQSKISHRTRRSPGAVESQLPKGLGRRSAFGARGCLAIQLIARVDCAARG